MQAHVISSSCHHSVVKLQHSLAVARCTTDCSAKLLIPMCAPVINVISSQLEGFPQWQLHSGFLSVVAPSNQNATFFIFFFFKYLIYVVAFLSVDVESAVCAPRGSLHGNREPSHKVKYGWDKSSSRSKLKSIGACLLLNRKEDLIPTFSLASLEVLTVFTAVLSGNWIFFSSF